MADTPACTWCPALSTAWTPSGPACQGHAVEYYAGLVRFAVDRGRDMALDPRTIPPPPPWPSCRICEAPFRRIWPGATICRSCRSAAAMDRERRKREAAA